MTRHLLPASVEYPVTFNVAVTAVLACSGKGSGYVPAVGFDPA